MASGSSCVCDKGGGDKSDDLGDLFFRAALWNAGARPKRPLLPWECEGSILADTLGQPSPSKAMRVEWPSQSLLDQDDLASVVSTAVSASDADLAGAGGLKLVVSKKWLKKSGQCRAWQDERDAARNAALQSWKALIMVSGTGTKLGAIILDAAEEDEELVLESVRMLFQARPRLRYAIGQTRCCVTDDGRPRLQMSKSLQCFRSPSKKLICYMRREGAPVSRVSRFVQALGFACGTLGAKVSDVLESPRVKGACSNTQPRQVHKKVPLTVAEVVFLETLAASSACVDAIIAGFVCFALHCRLRWSDAMRSEEEPVLDAPEGRGFVETSLYSYKTVAAMKFRLLPVVAVLPGMSKLDWAGNWLRNRRDHNLVASRNCPLQPAPVSTGGWSALPFEPMHGAMWLREKLAGMHVPVSRLSDIATHSLKATVLSWLSRAACPQDLQRRAGYHMSTFEKSALEYERDGQSAVLHFIEGVYECIIHAMFSPDASRSGRWSGCRSVEEGMKILAGAVDEVFPRATEGDGDASDLEDESEPDAQGAEADSEDEQMMAEVAVHQVAKAAPMAMPECIAFRHWMSGVVHLSPVVTSDDDGEACVFKCGRTANSNYEQLKFVPSCNTRQCSVCWM